MKYWIVPSDDKSFKIECTLEPHSILFILCSRMIIKGGDKLSPPFLKNRVIINMSNLKHIGG